MRESDFIRFVRGLTGGPEGVPFTWVDLAAWAQANPARFQPMLAVLREAANFKAPVDLIPLVEPPEGIEYEWWTERKRRIANLNALAALRQFQASGRDRPTAMEQRAMEAYSGWGGFLRVDQLPPDPRLFPPLYVQGIETWRRAREQREIPTGPGADLFEGLKHQYFTPVSVAQAMYDLSCRASPFRIGHVLEPSSGVGRFIRVGPEVQWTAVEYDALLAELAAATYPDAEVHHMEFERFARAAAETIEPGGGWDLVIGNPPYPPRGAKDKRLDPEFSKWNRADIYFAVRAMTLLRPGGLLCFVTPMSNVTGSHPENRAMREWLLQRAHFLGGVFPVSEIMPGVREGRFVIHLWVRRGTDNHVLTEYEREVILPGKYGETEAGKANTMGTWKRTERGRDEPHLTGTFDASMVVNAVLDPIPVDELESMRLARGGAASGATVTFDAPSGVVDDSDPQAPSEPTDPVVVSAVSLSERIETFSRRLAAGGAQANLAEAGRSELLTDLTEFIRANGNPHQVRGLRHLRKQLAPLLAAVEPDGSVSSGLVESHGEGYSDAPGAGASPQEVVAFYSKRAGVCTDLDLARHFASDVSGTLLADPSIAVEFQPDGVQWWYRNEEYTTGDLFDRLDKVETSLGGGEAADELVRVKLQDQKALLLGSIGEKSLTDIDVTPRSGFVPVECLSAWVNDTIYTSEYERAERAWANRWQARNRRHLVDPRVLRRRKAECYIEDGVLKIRHLGAALDEPEADWLVFLFGYWNRTLTVDDPEGRASGRKNMFKPNTDLETRMKMERELEGAFRMWLGQSDTWGTKIVEAYNRAYRGFKLREYDTAPVPIARWGAPHGWRLKAHQNQSVRRLVDRRGGVVALDVGLGKCNRYDTWVPTQAGLARIGDMFGDRAEGPEDELILPPKHPLMVQSFRGGQLQWTRVRALYRQRLPEAERTWRVETERGASIEVTGRHPFPVVRDGRIEWIQAADLVPGEFLAVADRLLEPEGAIEFPEDLIALLLWQVGEGYEPTGANTVKITQGDVAVLERLKATVIRYFGLGVTQMGLPDVRIVRGKGDRPSELVICKEAYRNFWAQAGYEWNHLSAAKSLPSWVLALTNRALRAALRAYFDAEGHVSSAGAVEVSSASPVLIEQIRYALLRFGVRGTVSEMWKAATNGTGIKRPYYRLTFAGDDLAAFGREVGFETEYKTAALQAIVAKSRNANTGIPVQAVFDDLEQAGVSIRMVLGQMRTAGLETVNRSTAEAMVRQLEFLASEIGVAKYAKLAARGGCVGRNSDRTYSAIRGQADLLLDAADRVRALLDSNLRFERIEAVSPGEVGGFVYDLHVEADEYEDQNYTAGLGGLLVHNTATSLAFAALMRQEGKSRRALCVVPSSVAGKWYAEASAWLPDYKIGLIGITPGKNGPVSDDQATRAEKWNRFAQGAYELCIATHDNFLIDVAVSQDRTAEIVGKMFWLQRGLGTGKAETEMLERKIEHLETQIANITEEGRKLEQSLRDLPDYSWNKGEKRDLQDRIAAIPGRLAKKREEIAATQKKLKIPSATTIEKARGAVEGFTADQPFRPKDDRFIIEWEALGVDVLVIDEAHRYKNIWQADQRFGQSIKYMGAMAQGETGRRGRKGGDEGEAEGGEAAAEEKTKHGSLTIRAWDMYLKCLDLLDRNNDGGVVALTATPVKNSPLELYNMLSLVSQRVWESRQVRSKEEFIDRFCTFERQMVADMTTGEVGYDLVMSGYSALGELRDILSTYLEYRTTKGVLQAQIEAGVPMDQRLVVPDDVPEQVTVPLGNVQREVYHRLREFIVDEQEKMREDKESPTKINALTLVLMSLLSKAALDPRLLVEDLEKIDRDLAATATYEARVAKWAAGGSKGKPPKAPDGDAMERMIRRRRILIDSGVAALVREYSESGEEPAKYRELAENIRQNLGCGHIIFANYIGAYPYIKAALREYAGVSEDQIITLTGADDKADRPEIALAFNGRDAVVVKGQVVEPALDSTKYIIIGTDAAMSEGIDLQRRTCAIHHLDYDWTPATIHQRNGRGVRQGNKLGAVAVRYYLAERTLDVVKLATTWGKANWLESLFGKAESVANPAAAMQGDIEEAIATLFAPDPEAAKKQLAELRARRASEELNNQRARAEMQFVSLVNQYNEYRAIRDPVAQSSKMALADKTAATMRLLPDTVFPRKELLGIARTKPVYYDITNDFVLYPRSLACFDLKSTVDPEAPVQVEHKLEIVSFRAQASKSGKPLVEIVVRPWGQFQTRVADGSLPALFGLNPDMASKFTATQQPTCEWDFAAEAEELTKPPDWRSPEATADLRDASPLLAEHLGQQVWVSRAGGYLGEDKTQGYKFIPLRVLGSPGRVMLARIGKGRYASDGGFGLVAAVGTPEFDALVKGTVPLYPSLLDSWRAFCDALRSGNIEVADVTKQGSSYSTTYPLIRRPLDLAAPGGVDYEAVTEMVRKWWGKLTPLAPLFREAQARQGVHGTDRLS